MSESENQPQNIKKAYQDASDSINELGNALMRLKASRLPSNNKSKFHG